jgi:two-component system, OmpR family, catabolic regulation response regulator CreB
MNKPKILIVEDESGIADTIRYALSTDGFEPVWCDTGEKALDVLSKDVISLVVLDVGLPDVNGFDLFKTIQARWNVPAIFLTARSEEIDRVVGLELGADDYIAKPFSPRELSARVKTVLRRVQKSQAVQSTTASPKQPTVKPFDINEEKRRVLYYGRLLELSRYEFGLLSTLLARPGRIFSRDELLDLIWDEPVERFDRTVDTHIKTLRAKLSVVTRDFDPIITHRGIGYSMAENLPASP